jgi:hypothetical protein
MNSTLIFRLQGNLILHIPRFSRKHLVVALEVRLIPDIYRKRSFSKKNAETFDSSGVQQ